MMGTKHGHSWISERGEDLCKFVTIMLTAKGTRVCACAYFFFLFISLYVVWGSRL